MKEVEELGQSQCKEMSHWLSFSSIEWAGFLLLANGMNYGLKGTFPPEFIEMRVVNAQVGMKNLPLCERQRFLFQYLQNGPFEGLSMTINKLYKIICFICGTQKEGSIIKTPYTNKGWKARNKATHENQPFFQLLLLVYHLSTLLPLPTFYRHFTPCVTTGNNVLQFWNKLFCVEKIQ